MSKLPYFYVDCYLYVLITAERETKSCEAGIREGIEAGIFGVIGILQELGYEDGVLIQKLMDKFKLTEEEAKEFICNKKQVLNRH